MSRSTHVPARRVDPPRTEPAGTRTVPVVIVGIALVVLLLGISGQANAWGAQGHRIMGELAQMQLTPSAHEAVQKLLAGEPEPTLAGVAPWADTVRTRGTAAFHYVNLPPGDCHFSAQRDCPTGKCLPIAIAYYRTLMVEQSASAATRAEALKWVVHLVGDVTQPLHSGWASDRGGNSYQIQWEGRGTNLHALWDTRMIRSVDANWRHYAKALSVEPSPAVDSLNAADWVQQACRVVNAPGFYPDRHPDGAYLATWQPIMEYQLRLGGARLAAVLNAAFP